jgi:hypothetical protein
LRAIDAYELYEWAQVNGFAASVEPKTKRDRSLSKRSVIVGCTTRGC